MTDEISVNAHLSDAAESWEQRHDSNPTGESPMTKQQGEEEAVRRWYLLPDHLRTSYEAAEAYAIRLDAELDFPTITSRQRLIAAWLIREVTKARNAERDARLEAEALALAAQAA